MVVTNYVIILIVYLQHESMNTEYEKTKQQAEKLSGTAEKLDKYVYLWRH